MGAIVSSLYSIVFIEFQDHIIRVMTSIEICLALSSIVFVNLGTLLYSELGYFWTFFLTAIFSLIGTNISGYFACTDVSAEKV